MTELIFCIAVAVVVGLNLFNLYRIIREWALDRAIRKRKEREKK